MKKIYSILFLLLIFGAKNSSAQNDCSTPYPILSSTGYTFPLVTGTPNPDNTNDYGCLTTPSQNVTWGFMGVCTSGSFTLTASSSSSNDIDIIVWGPLSSATTCGLTAPQIIDCSASTATTETVNFTGLAGEYFKIMITNFGGSPGTVSLVQTGGTGIACDSTTFGCWGAVPMQEICQVTTDPILNHNIIIWNKDTAYTGDYFIEKETTTMGVYAPLATVLNNDTSAYEDLVSNPMIQAFKYRIKTADTCGNTAIGIVHKTIHLLTSISSSTGYPQLSWNPYSGFSYGTYFIFRGSSPATLTLYDSISASSTSYTDVAAVSGMNYYAVSVVPPSPCTPSHSMAFSYSNVAPANFVGIAEHEFANLSVGPNPANEILNFTLGEFSPEMKIDVIDIAGRIVVSKTYTNVLTDNLSLNEISNGSYVVKFSNKNGMAHKNIVVVR